MELWRASFGQKNEDYKGIYDEATWTLTENDGNYTLAFVDTNDYTSEVKVKGDVLAAKDQIPETDANWPSLWLGPQSNGDWDELLAVLGLERA